MRIKTSIFNAERDVGETLGSALQAEVEKAIGPLLEGWGAIRSSLHAILEIDDADERKLGLRLCLHMPGRRAAAVQAWGDNIEQLATNAVAKLRGELELKFSALRKADSQRRAARGKRLHLAQEASEQISPDKKEMLKTYTCELRPILAEHARRELAYLRAVGDLPEGTPQVDDVVDEALATLIASDAPIAHNEDLLPIALHHLYNAVDAELEAGRIMMESVPLDAELADDAQDDAEEMVEEELFEFFQPDDHVTLGDVLHRPFAQAHGHKTDLQADISAIEFLKELPRQWRRAFLLLSQDGFNANQIATILDAVDEQIEELIKAGKTYLAAKLSEKGMGDWLAETPSLEKPSSNDRQASGDRD